MMILPKYISLLVGLWELLFKIGILVSRLKLSRDSGFSKSRQSRLIRDAWTLCKVFFLGGGGPRGMLPWKKIRNLRSSDCWKCIEIVNLTITMLFCIILNILRSHQADLFGSWGGGWHPPAYGPDIFTDMQHLKKGDRALYSSLMVRPLTDLQNYICSMAGKGRERSYSYYADWVK